MEWLIMERVVDIVLTIDGINLKEGENIEDLLPQVAKIFDTIYPLKYEVTNEEFYDD